ncbi:MAG: UDP-4-amino-4,6-dideoxy-N-acetyl-beta-L-altrosamine N-acetyltransferase [Cellulosilyticum sp.]|nr:UDP-4-amino-4,6-dideoxy-N-acetyl-beta-L-altrosamine N-acetyltransferase [Cellulosilyticum sp.]
MEVKNTQDVIFRPMRESDLAQVMEWRMQPDITKYMSTDPKLTLEGQYKWFYKQKENPNNYLFIIEVDQLPVGVFTILDLDEVNSRCSSGLYIAVKEKRSLELAMRIEWGIYEFIFGTLKLNKTYAEIFSDNRGVIRLKKMCGSEIEGELKQHIYKNGVYYDITVMGMYADKWREIKKGYKYKEIKFEL